MTKNLKIKPKIEKKIQKYFRLILSRLVDYWGSGKGPAGDPCRVLRLEAWELADRESPHGQGIPRNS